MEGRIRVVIRRRVKVRGEEHRRLEQEGVEWLQVHYGSSTHYQSILNPMKSVKTVVVDNGESLIRSKGRQLIPPAQSPYTLYW